MTVLLLGGMSFGQTGPIYTYAGNGSTLYSGDGVPATTTSVSGPGPLAADSLGNVYIVDAGNHRIRRVDAQSKIITTVIDNVSSGCVVGISAPAVNLIPFAIRFDQSGNLYYADCNNNRVLRVDTVTGTSTVVAGTGAAGSAGDGGSALSASLNLPTGLAFDLLGNLLIADWRNNRIRRVDVATGIISTIAGNGAAGFSGDGGPASLATLNGPAYLTVDPAGNVYFSDLNNNRLRRIDANTGTISTVAGTGVPTFNGDGIPAISANLLPGDLSIDPAGAIYIADPANSRIRRLDVSTGRIWTVAGNPIQGGSSITEGGSAQEAPIKRPLGILWTPPFALYLSEAALNRVLLVQLSPPWVDTASTVSTPSSTVPAGVPVPLTAVVQASNGGDSGGFVGFLEITGQPYLNFLGSAPVVNGTATFSANLSLGAHSVVAWHPGMGNFGGSYSPIYTLQVATPVSVSVNSSRNPTVFGENIILTASLSVPTATGKINFSSDGSPLASVDVVNGVGTLTLNYLSEGSHNIVAQYAGDTTYPSATSPALIQVVKAASAVALSSSSNPATVGQSVTFTATITPAKATGTVQLLDGATVLGAAPVVSGSASISLATLSVGTHTLTAAYSGDSATGPSVSPTLNQGISKQTTNLTVASSLNPATVGQNVTFTATLNPSATGAIQFLDGGAVIGSGVIASGSASYSAAGLSAGVHTISAVYAGDGTFQSASSAPLSQVVKANTTIVVTSGVNPSVSGQTVNLLATLSPPGTAGSVQFLDGTTVLGSASLSAGTASLSLSNLAVGSHAITASYGGDASYAGSVSAVWTQQVNPPPPAPPTALTASAAGPTQINLAWSPSATAGATYDVYASTVSGFTPSTATRIASGVIGTSYAHTGLSGSTTWFYRVIAITASGQSAWSPQASATTTPAVSCHVTYEVRDQWNVGFTSDITIKNTGSTPIQGWILTWRWPSGQSITRAWGADETQTGANVQLTSLSYNSQIAPGATVSKIGLNGSDNGTNITPVAFYLNGSLCK